MRRRVWCETLTFAELSPALLALLAERQIELLLAVRPWDLPTLADTAARIRAAGVYLGVWPMLGDAHGRWASVHSMVGFIALCDSVLSLCDPEEVAIDLEPPKEVLEKWLRLRPSIPTARNYRVARDALASAVARWRRRAASYRRITTAVLPLLVLERGELLQRALGTPATELPVDAHSVMAYSSLYEGWSRGLVGRANAERLLHATAVLARRRFGARAAISVGCIGPGAFGDEPSYRDPGELRRDVAIARDAGIHELALFDLGGAVRRGGAAVWLDAFA